MRENIGLFRGKWVGNGEWVEGYLLRSKIKGEIRYEIYAPFTEEEEKENEGHIFSSVGGIWHEVDPDTIGECTGVKANGELIFEGDIITCYRFGEKWYESLPVEWSELFGEWQTLRQHNLYNISGFKYEINGNIHDNPELLKGGEGK